MDLNYSHLCTIRHSFVFVIISLLVFSGKKRRLTFMECNNDINTMIDLAKVADLVRLSMFLLACLLTLNVL